MNPPDHPDPDDLRDELARRGYLPIAVAGKAPLARNWQAYVHQPGDRLPRAIRGVEQASTGIRCSGVVALDLDIPEPSVRDDVRDIVERHLGETPCVRWRDHSAKIAMFYRPEPFFEAGKGIRFRLSNLAKLEVYAQGGVQIVVSGEHADSTPEAPIHYRWEDLALWEVDRADLPPVSAEQVKQVVRETVAAFPPPDGAEASLRGDAMPARQAVQNIASAQDFHGSTMALAGHLIADGLMPRRVLDIVSLIYSAVDVRSLSPERARDYWKRRDDLARCVHDAARAELRKRDTLYREVLAGRGEDHPDMQALKAEASGRRRR